MKKNNTTKASWWVRSRRKTFVREVVEILKPYQISEIWVHAHFLHGENKRPKQATFYISFLEDKHADVFLIEAEADKHFKRRKINIIDVSTLQPTVKAFVFKDLEKVF